jgi:RNA recognition motif-containing protein
MSDKIATELISLAKRVEELEKIILNRNRKDDGQRRNRDSAPGAVNIYIGNLSYDINDSELNELFEEFGEIISTSITRDKYSGKSRGFGFVEMPVREEAMKAINSLNGKEIKGRKINVNESHPKESRRDNSHDRDRKHDNKGDRGRDWKPGGFRDTSGERSRGRNWGSDKGEKNGKGKDRKFSRDDKKKFYGSKDKKRGSGKGKIRGNKGKKKMFFGVKKKDKKW